jgi:hypothetical protein
MPDRMPENMSDRMPEDLPVRKCINVMVGITGIKVILIFQHKTHTLLSKTLLSSPPTTLIHPSQPATHERIEFYFLLCLQQGSFHASPILSIFLY